jgi:AcrR family transcriptional regulator
VLAWTELPRARGANKRMLYYYFGNKEDLFLAVLESALRAHPARRARLQLGAFDPAEGIRRLIVFTWEYFLKHPEFLTLLNSENLHRGRHLRRSRQVAAMHSPLVAILRDLLERGVRGGQVSPRRGSGAALHLDSSAGLLLSRQPPHAVDHLRA